MTIAGDDASFTISNSHLTATITFDAGLLKAGDSNLNLTIPGGGLTSGIIYDYLRLEAGEPR